MSDLFFLKWQRLLLLFVIPLLHTIVLLGSTSSVDAGDSIHPLESTDTSSPKATLQSFLSMMHQTFEIVKNKEASKITHAEFVAIRRQIFRCMDLSEITPAVRTSLSKEAAVCLKEVLDRIELPPEYDWPDADKVVEDKISKWMIPHTEITIVKIKEGPREGEFLFSASTIDQAIDFYELIKRHEYKDRPTVTPGFYNLFVSEPGWMISSKLIPTWARTRWFGQAIWQWTGLLLTLILSLVVMLSIYLFGRLRTKKLRSNLTRYLVTLIFPLAAMLVPLAANYFVVEQLHLYGNLVLYITFVFHLIFLFALMVLVVSVGSRLAELIIATPWVQPAGLDAQLVRLTCRVLSIIGASIVLLEGGRQFGVPLTTLLTGAGVSGFAIALAAQDSLKSILGSMMIMLDKPYRVGERIVTKGFDGFVEDIGLRSTKIRLLTGHLVFIPNEEMARIEIENISRRPFIRHAVTIELPSDTPSEKIKRALEILREILKNHEGMSEEYPPRVFLRDVNENSIGIFISYWYHPPDYWKFLAFSEGITIKMTDKFEEEEISFASPALTLHIPKEN